MRTQRRIGKHVCRPDGRNRCRDRIGHVLALLDSAERVAPLEERLADWDEAIQAGPLPELPERRRAEVTARLVAELERAGPTASWGIVYSVGPDGAVRRSLPA